MVGPTRDRVGESPVWDEQQQALWWVDIEGCQVRRWSARDNQTESWRLPQRVGCIALLADGRVLAAMQDQVALARLQPGLPAELSTLARVTHPASGMRFNDGRCDPTGRMWLGSMVMDMTQANAAGGLYCLDEHGLTGPHIRGLLTANGLGFSADGHRLYLSDSHPQARVVWACTLEGGSGQLGPRVPFADFSATSMGRPDGAAVDAEDCYWVCGNDAGLIHRFAPDGRHLGVLHVPVTKPSMCAFGGADMRTLFVTSILPGGVDAINPGLNGALLATELTVAGRAEPRFARLPPTTLSH